MAFEDPYDVPAAPRPPTLPELTHAEVEATFETTAGALLRAAGQGPAHAYVQRLGVEVPLGLRRWYVGADYEFAAGDGKEGRFEVAGGNVVVDGRTLWATATGLAFGGGLGLALPTATFQPGSGGELLAQHVATLRPWDVSFFVPNVFGVRPFVDVRAVDGPFVVQFRQGLDVTSTNLSFADPHVYATAGVYFGWRMTAHVAWGLEAFETYAVDVPGVADDARATFVASPSVRLVLPWIQPAVSVFTGIGKPFESTTDSIWGFRLAITFVYRGDR